MKLLTDTNEVALRLREPKRITALIPHAREHDDNVVIVPHSLEETKLLRNLGLQVPAPILHNYDWPRNVIQIPFPFDHQRESSAFMTLHKRCFVLLDMGLGKSLAALWAADWLMKHGFIRRALILSTLSCLDPTWQREIFRNMMHRTSVVVHGTRKQRLMQLKEDVDFFIMNHHGLLVVPEELKARDDIDLVIMDEASMMRNSRTKIYKTFKGYMRPHQWLWMLTGKPCPNGPTDAWGLAHLVSPDRVPKFFTRWQDETMMKVSMFKWVPRPGSTEKMYKALQPAIRYEKKDCLDLPPTIYQDRQTTLSTLQQQYYKRIKEQLVVYAGEHQVTAANAAILLGKLLQICAGAVKTDAGEYIGLDIPERLALLDEIIDESSAKVMVFVPYTGALRTVTAHLRKLHGDAAVAQIDGSTTRHERKTIFNAFQDHALPKLIVAHPKVAAHGLNLTAADTIAWFSPVHSLDIYDQANERMARPGQKLQTNIVHMGACPLEWAVYKVLKSKGRAQEEFLELFREEMEDDDEV